MQAALLAVFQPMGVDFFCLGKKYLTFNLLGRNLKVKYRRSAIGVLWTLMNPLAMAAIYYFVFKVVMGAKSPNFHVFVLTGILAWTFFSTTIVEGTEAIVGNWSLVSKVPIPIQIFAYSGALTNLVTYLISLPILIGAALLSGIALRAPFGLMLFYIPLLFVLTYSIALILSIAFVFFRDLKHIMTIIFQIWLYATPVLYEVQQVPPKYRFLFLVNPVAQIFAGLHTILMHGEWPSSEEVVVPVLWTAVFVFLALWLLKSQGKRVAEKV